LATRRFDLFGEPHAPGGGGVLLGGGGQERDPVGDPAAVQQARQALELEQGELRRSEDHQVDPRVVAGEARLEGVDVGARQRDRAAGVVGRRRRQVGRLWSHPGEMEEGRGAVAAEGRRQVFQGVGAGRLVDASGERRRTDLRRSRGTDQLSGAIV